MEKRVKTANLRKHHQDDIFMLTADIDFFSGNIIYYRSTSFHQNCISKKRIRKLLFLPIF